MARSVDYSIRWHIKFQFEELAKAIEERAKSHNNPETAEAVCEVAIVVRKQADEIIL